MMKNKLMGTGILLTKSGHCTFHTGKPGNFKSLREVISIILLHCYLEIDCRVSAKKVLWL